MVGKIKGNSPVQIKDQWGDSVVLTGSRAWAVDMSTQASDYDLGVQGLVGSERPEFFFIVPQLDGVIEVELQNADEGETYIITAVEIESFLGSPLQYRVKKVIKAGTTATFTATI